ncbi:hypothetical protein [Sulfitobacter pontiacus]|uniref:hypothetical protein n=1 Tax=Sulfitobacter pontiacus TaxID=60137 RepID=UPI000A3DB849|nr:hypothetical protein [Sulfitobacter pontiacus]
MKHEPDQSYTKDLALSKVAHKVGPITNALNPSYGSRQMNIVDGPWIALVFPGVVGQIS